MKVVSTIQICFAYEIQIWFHGFNAKDEQVYDHIKAWRGKIRNIYKTNHDKATTCEASLLSIDEENKKRSPSRDCCEYGLFSKRE